MSIEDTSSAHEKLELIRKISNPRWNNIGMPVKVTSRRKSNSDRTTRYARLFIAKDGFEVRMFRELLTIPAYADGNMKMDKHGWLRKWHLDPDEKYEY